MQNLTHICFGEHTRVKLYSIWKIALVFVLINSMPLKASEQFNSKTDELLVQLKSAGNDTLKANILMQIALEQYYINTQEAIHYSNLALNTFKNCKVNKGVGRCNNILGAAYFSLGEFKLAETYYLKANNIANEVGDTLYISKSLNNLGNVSQKLGKLEKAVDYYTQSINLYKLTSNITGEIGVLNNIAAIYYSVGNLNKALKIYKQAEQLAEKINDGKLLSAILNNITSIYTEQENYELALIACNESYEIRKEMNYSSNIIKNLIAFGSIYSGMEVTDSARKYFNKALELAKTNGQLSDQASILLQLGYIDFISQNYTNAEKLLSSGLIVAESVEDKGLQQEFHKYLYQVDSTNQQFKNAFLHLQKYNQIKSDYSGFNPDKQIEELQTKYALTRQENIAQGAALKRNRIFSICSLIFLVALIFLAIIFIQQIKLKAEKRISELSQENLRSQINPHFIFNVLNSIHSYILTNDKKASSEYLLKFAKLLRLTLDNSQSNLTTINDELEALKLYLDLESIRMNNKLEYKITVDDEIDPYMFKIPPLLIQPYVENSILHGLKNKEGVGKIDIQLIYEDNQIHCSIVDNGIGRKKAQELNSGKKIKRKSYGSSITENRLKLLNSFYGKKMNMMYSDLFDEKNNPNGTKVEFNLPILN